MPISFLLYCGHVSCYRLRTHLIDTVGCSMLFEQLSRKRVQELCIRVGCHQSLEWCVHELVLRMQTDFELEAQVSGQCLPIAIYLCIS
jgi:hypothetical protein